MSNVKNFGLDGVAGSLQLDKNGPRFERDGAKITARAHGSSNLTQIQAADPVDPQDLVTRSLLQTNNVFELPVSYFGLADSWDGGTLVLPPAHYLFASYVAFPANFAGSFAWVDMASGTSVTVNIIRTIVGGPITQVGTLVVDSSGSFSFTAVNNETMFMPSDRLTFEWVPDGNVEAISITLKGMRYI